MQRPLKFTLLSLTGLTATVLFLWMHSLASWRPIKLGQVNPPYSIGFLSNDSQTTLLKTDDMLYSVVLNMNNGREIDWPEHAFPLIHFSQTSPEWAFVFEEKKGRGELRAREIQSGELKRTFRWPLPTRQEYPEIILSHDEKIVSAVDSPHLFQWDIESGKLLRQVRLEKPFLSSDETTRFTSSLDGSRLLGCAAGEGKIWQIPAGHILQSWTTKAMGFPAFVAHDGRVVAYTYPTTTDVQPYSFVDTTTGKIMWSTKDNALKNTDNIGLSSFCDDEVFVPRAANCEVLDSFTGHVKRKLTYPRQSDGSILRVTPDRIYTQNHKGEIFRWRAR